MCVIRQEDFPNGRRDCQGGWVARNGGLGGSSWTGRGAGCLSVGPNGRVRAVPLNSVDAPSHIRTWPQPSPFSHTLARWYLVLLCSAIQGSSLGASPPARQAPCRRTLWTAECLRASLSVPPHGLHCGPWVLGGRTDDIHRTSSEDVFRGAVQLLCGGVSKSFKHALNLLRTVTGLHCMIQRAWRVAYKQLAR